MSGLHYEAWQKSNGTDFLFTKAFVVFKHQCYPLQNSCLGRLHTDGDLFPVLVAALEVFKQFDLQHEEMTSFEDNFKFREKEKVTWPEVR